jgi:hypothetical protein
MIERPINYKDLLKIDGLFNIESTIIIDFKELDLGPSKKVQ